MDIVKVELKEHEYLFKKKEKISLSEMKQIDNIVPKRIEVVMENWAMDQLTPKLTSAVSWEGYN